MRLLAIADEACAGVGYPPPGRRDGSLEAVKFVYEEYQAAAARPAGGEGFFPYLPTSIARAVPSDRACVLPKGLTPDLGCTLGSTTHNLALLPGRGQVTAEWRLSDWPKSGGPKPASAAQRFAPFNLLIIPYPYTLNGQAFRSGRDPDGPDADGYFELDMLWLPPGDHGRQVDDLARFIVALIEAAQAEGGLVNAVVLPETSLPSAVAEPLAKKVAGRCATLEMFIAGVTAPPPIRPAGAERPFGRNAAYVARFDHGRRVDQYSQCKHDRRDFGAVSGAEAGAGQDLGPFLTKASESLPDPRAPRRGSHVSLGRTKSFPLASGPLASG